MTPANLPSRFPLVTLRDDRQFRGYAFAKYVDNDGEETGYIAIDVVTPGQTKLRGCVPVSAERLEVLD